MILGQRIVNAARALVAAFQDGIVTGATALDTGTPQVLPTGLTAEQLATADAEVGGVRAGVATDLEVLRAAAILDAVGGTKWRNVGDAGEPAFAGTWVNFNTATHTRLGFRADAFGRVQLKGNVATGTVPSALCTLPLALERAVQLVGIDSAGTAARITISTAGVVTVQSGSNTQISLDGLSFSLFDS
jgi:hypothetical protein